MTSTPSPVPDTESARRLIRDLTESTADFTRQLDAIETGGNVLELSGAYFDFCEDLFSIFRQARLLRNEVFQASVRAASPDLLTASELAAAREFSAKVLAEHREST